jgi:D-glycero-alpha-D-manno-heptose-7-phosphate kinase
VILARAPLRISLGGGGTDIPSYYSQHGGFILSAAINKYVYIYLNRPAADTLLRIKYSKYEQVESVSQIQHDLVRPTLELLKIDGNLEIVSMADVPDGTGMGSSGSYLVSLLTALFDFKRERVPTQVLAETACHVEMDLAHHAAGKHDHYLAAFGGITTLEIDTDGKVRVSPLDISLSTAEALRSGTLLYYTGITRKSSGILEQQRADTLSGNSEVIDSLHFTKSLGYRIKDALEAGDLDNYGHLLHEHWQNKKRRSSKISNERIDELYNAARANGALGGKIMGAGGGGFLMLYCPPSAKLEVRRALSAQGVREMAFDFDYDGAKVLINF